MMNTYVIATPPLPSRVRRDMGLGDVMLWDTEQPYHYARWTPDRRLLFGGQDRPKLPRAARPDALDRRAESLSAELAELYPALSGDGAGLRVGRAVRDDARRAAVHRRAPPLSATAVRARLRRQRHDVRLPGGGLLVRAARGKSAPDDELFGFGRLR